MCAKKTSMKTLRARNHEDHLQEQCIAWFEAFFRGSERLRIHHSPNGGKRNLIEAAKFKRMGVRAGFPDLWISLGNGQTGFIELKYGRNGLTDAQKTYRDFLIEQGYRWALCRSLDEFISALQNWGLMKNKRRKDDL